MTDAHIIALAILFANVFVAAAVAGFTSSILSYAFSRKLVIAWAVCVFAILVTPTIQLFR